MRLSAHEVQVILEEVGCLDFAAEVYLFGSRARDDLKGGDIDLVVLSEKLKFSDKLTLLVKLKSRLGDQKIDVKIASRQFAGSDPFILSVMPGAQKLKVSIAD